MYEDTTIAAIATAPGAGGIGIIRLSGREALCVAESVFRPARGEIKNAEPYRMMYGHVADGERIIDEGLFVYMKAPHSYTGEDVCEIQIHGSAEALRETLALCFSHGAEPAAAGAFTERAFLNGRLDLAQAEAVMDIISARGKTALRQAESHLAGALSGYVRGVRASLKDLITKLEVTVDYPEEDIEDFTRDEIAGEVSEIVSSMETLLARSETGRILREGLRTAIIGRPNAGKSSLLNALLREDRAIVTDIPGTTRDTIEETVNVGGATLVLMDTAGLRRTENEIEQIGIERAKKSMETADLILAVLDASQPVSEEDKAIFRTLSGRRAIIILNKCDLEARVSEKEIETEFPGIPVLTLSAKTGAGTEKLEAALTRIVETEDMETGRALLLTNMRHENLMRRAAAALTRARDAAEAAVPADCIAVDLTEAFTALGDITGETVDDELIHSIFARFCVGK